MKLWPAKQQWEEWSLPSKLTALSFWFGAVGIILTILMWLQSQMSESTKAGAADRDTARNFLQAAINLERDKQHQKALEKALSSIRLDPKNSDAIYYSAYIQAFSIQPHQLIQAHDLLISHQEDLDEKGKWLLGITHCALRRNKEGCDIFDQLPDLTTIPYAIRAEALDAYLTCAASDGFDRFISVAQKIQIYVDKTILDQTQGGNVVPLGAAEHVPVLKFDPNIIINLPRIKFRIGTLSLMMYIDRNKSEGFPLALQLINEGFMSAFVFYRANMLYEYCLPVRRLCRLNNLETKFTQSTKQNLDSLAEQLNKLTHKRAVPKDLKSYGVSIAENSLPSGDEREKLLDMQQLVENCSQRLTLKRTNAAK